MKKVFSVLLVLLLMCGCAGVSSKNESQVDKSKAALKVGLECDYAPYNWTTTESKKSKDAVMISGSKNYCEGYDVMIAKKIAKYLDMNLEIKKTSWDGLIPALNSGQIDVIIAGMSPTAERKQNIDFSNAYYKDDLDQGIVVKKSSDWAKKTKKNQFKDAKITAQQGTLQVSMLDQLPAIQKVAQLPDYGSLMQALKSDTIDGYIAEMAVATEHVAANDNFAIVNLDKNDSFELSDEQTTTAVGVKKGNTALVTKLNDALKTISEKDRVQMMDDAKKQTDVEQRGFFEKIVYLLENYSSLFVDGIAITILVAVVGTTCGLILALALVFMRSLKVHFKDNIFVKISKRILNFLAIAYIDIIRGTPMMVQAAIFFYGVGTKVFGLTILPAALIIVSFNTAAYIAEIIRSGINALGNNQMEAGLSLGMTRFQVLRKVIYPQALRNSLPALSNELIVNVKDSSVLSIIGLSELFYSAKAAGSSSYLIEETFILAALMYFIITFVLTRLLGFIINGRKRKLTISSQTVPEVIENEHN